MKKIQKFLKLLSLLTVVGLTILPANFAFATSAGGKELTDREKAAFIVRDEWTTWVNAFTASLSELDKNATARIYDNMDYYDMQYRFTEKYKKVPEYLDEDGKPTQKLKDLIKKKRKEIAGAKQLDYLCFTSKQNGSTIKYTLNGALTAADLDIGYSYDGTSFAPWTPDTNITLDSGKELYVWNKKSTFSKTAYKYAQFVTTGNLEASGDINSLVNFGTPGMYAYYSLFYNNTALYAAPELLSTTVGEGTYAYMFKGCSNLKTAPTILPAKTLDNDCYKSMFENCSSLEKAPILAATTLANGCFTKMFSGCSLLNEISIAYTKLPTAAGVPGNAFENWVDGVANTGTFYCDIDVSPSAYVYGASALPKNDSNRWNIVNTGLNFLTLTSKKNGSTVRWTSYVSSGSLSLNNIFYSRDKINWTNWDGSELVLNNNENLYIWNKNSTLSTSVDSAYMYFVIPESSNIELSGNIKSLLNFEELSNHCFTKLFRECKGIKSASKLQLSSTTLRNFCYSHMFYGCSYLKDAPTLPATTLAVACYNSMFNGCSRLLVAPNLPATTLSSRCYTQMFADCSSLTTVPERLPGGNFSWNNYYGMFRNCSSIVKAPILKIESFVSGEEGFKETPLKEMFKGCTSLKEIRLDYSGSFTVSGVLNPFMDWVHNVASNGDFYYSGPDETRGNSAIPTGWNLHPFTS